MIIFYVCNITYIFLVIFFSQQNSATQAALQAAQALVNHSSDTQGGPNTVLRVIVDNQIYPVTLEILYQVNYFSLKF